ncbi:MAG: hypothetical protein EOM30_03925 [Clostridia bacterium]|jgi:ribosomal protein L37AE/L43A|nr:hypothetical protein [Clostridia bacterium]NLS84049.1 hypothetical protein [Oscillospiraceae bacterium]
MKERFRRFMVGRYGMDGFGQFINIAAIVCMVLGLIARTSVFYFVGLGLVAYEYFRMLSRNTQRRIAENYAFYGVRQRIVAWFDKKKTRFAQRKLYKYFKCPSCRQQLRVPRGKGNLEICCPKCHTSFTKKS